MKSAFVTGIKAFVSQAKLNYFEHSKKVVERQGYTVTKTQPKQKDNK